MRYLELIEQENQIAQDLLEVLKTYKSYRSSRPENVDFAKGQEAGAEMILEEIRYVLEKHGYKVG